jgi:putative oxidoreductase
MCSFSKVVGRNGSRQGNEENTERSTPNVARRIQQVDSAIGRWTLDVGRWTFRPRNGYLIMSVETVPGRVLENERRKSQFVWRVLDFVIGALFIYAGAVKVLDPMRFGIDIDSYKILPWSVAVRFAFYLPWLEIFCGVALITRRLYLGSLVVLILLVVVFIGATISVKVRGLDLTCGCFGHLSSKLSFGWHLALDFGILAVLIALWFSRRESRATAL